MSLVKSNSDGKNDYKVKQRAYKLIARAREANNYGR